MRFSVCIPTFNRAALLPKAIESVLLQSHTDFELVILDNASTDETRDLLSQLSDPRIRTFTNSSTISMYANHNLCAHKAREDWIVFLHSDDALHPNALEAIAKHAAFKDSSVIMPAKELHFEAGITDIVKLFGVGAIPELLRLPSATPTGAAIQKSALLRQPYLEDEIAADLHFLAQVLGSGGCIRIIPDAIVDIGMGEFQYTANWRRSGQQTFDIAHVFRMVAEMPGAEQEILASLPIWSASQIARLLLLLSCSGKKKLVQEIESTLAPRRDYRNDPSYKHVRLQKVLGATAYKWSMMTKAKTQRWQRKILRSIRE